MSEEMSISTLFSKMKIEMEKQANLITDKTVNAMMTMDDKIKPVMEENQNLKSEINILNKKINTLENVIKKNNIVIHGFEENETSYNQLFKNITYLLQQLDVNIDDNDISKLYRIGKLTSEKTRPIIITLATYNKKMEILKNKNKMPQPSYITEDFTKETLQKRKELQNELRLQRERGNYVYIKNNKVVVKQRGNKKKKRIFMSACNTAALTCDWHY
ncbi:uncharacterized protein LOC125073888 [Vanessa atalanta]|uniref:uncharacterized protein LOC125073888 n=1 Tax=Vanessa atalanta TaxID=42275 RepID=UPI001FCDA6C4|nr:uncharacterized protein LOC125073888 [Vanessa atalanta]